MDTVITGHIVRHSASELFQDGSARFTGIEIETHDGESVWLNEVGMRHRVNAVFEGAMQDGEPVTVWLLGNRKGSFMYGISAGKSYAYQAPPRSTLILASLQPLVIGFLSAFFIIGIPIFLYGLYLLIKGLTLGVGFTEDEVRRGVTERSPTPARAGVAEPATSSSF